jgi:hypothetical protein
MNGKWIVLSTPENSVAPDTYGLQMLTMIIPLLIGSGNPCHGNPIKRMYGPASIKKMVVHG